MCIRDRKSSILNFLEVTRMKVQNRYSVLLPYEANLRALSELSKSIEVKYSSLQQSLTTRGSKSLENIEKNLHTLAKLTKSIGETVMFKMQNDYDNLVLTAAEFLRNGKPLLNVDFLPGFIAEAQNLFGIFIDSFMNPLQKRLNKKTETNLSVNFLRFEQERLLGDLTQIPKNCLGFSESFEKVYLVHRNNTVAMLDLEEFKKEKEVQLDKWISSLCIVDKRRIGFVGDQTGSILRFELPDFKNSFKWKAHNYWLTHLHYSEQMDSLISCALDGSISFWSLLSKLPSHLKTVTGSKGYINNLAFDAKSETLFIGSDTSVISVWSLSGSSDWVELNEHKDKVTALVFDDSTRRLISGSNDGNVRMWRLGDPGALFTLDEEEGSCRAFTACGNSHQRTLIAGFASGRVKLYNLNDGDFLSLIATLPSETSDILGLMFIPRERKLVVAHSQLSRDDRCYLRVWSETKLVEKLRRSVRTSIRKKSNVL
eukprot:TRINITY_DN4735_c0_g1_i4.p1 TRINITY_DN4735_c0_g1~~TRINITY_DN4735_c0_g1_i4.p1  ORF type:complete len:484 (-),score=53.92 TRINITY_DN4735_c0_g1_i4:623-2074(-)